MEKSIEFLNLLHQLEVVGTQLAQTDAELFSIREKISQLRESSWPAAEEIDRSSSFEIDLENKRFFVMATAHNGR